MFNLFWFPLRRLSVVAALALGCGVADAAECTASDTFALALHGGSFNGREPRLQQVAHLEVLVTELGRILRDGDRSLSVVQRAVVGMEDSGLFNAGRGARHNAAGVVETDAAIMSGANGNAGAVASIIGLKNPVIGARLVMENTRHVMLVGDRGRDHLLDLGAESVTADYFINTRHRETPGHGTVGAVALDRCGDLAAATSTGGYDAKIPGRVGDVPVIGAGTYAENGVAAISATGHGEYFIRHNAAASVVARMRFGGQNAAIAARTVLDEMAVAGRRNKPSSGRQEGLGGLIVVTADGGVEMPYSTFGMLRAAMSSSQPPFAASVAR